MSNQRKPGVTKKAFPINAFCLLVFGGSVVYALALEAHRQRSEDDTFGQKTRFEHRNPAPQASADEMALNKLIDKSVAQAEAHEVPGTAVAMLELYGTDRESRWATKIAKGE